jgi:hypothetical protein
MLHPDAAIAIDPDEAERVAAVLAPCLPASLAPWFDARFIRSDRLFDEYVSRLTVQVAREVGLEEALADGGTAAEAVARARLDPRRAVVPVDWMLRRLAARGLLVVDEPRAGGPRFRARAPLPVLDAAAVRAEQARHDAASLPSYALAEAAAQMYPAFLAGTRSGEDILLAPSRLGLWSRYFSNDHPLYAVNNRVAATALVASLGEGPNTVLRRRAASTT